MKTLTEIKELKEDKKESFNNWVSYDFYQSDLENIRKVREVNAGNIIKTNINWKDIWFAYLVIESKDWYPWNATFVKISNDYLEDEEKLKNIGVKIDWEIFIERNITELGTQEIWTTVDQLNFSLYSEEWAKDLYSKINKLKDSEKLEDKVWATFLESFVWKYDEAIEDRKNLCETIEDEKEYKKYCEKELLTINSFRPVDQDWNIIPNTIISINWQEEARMWAITKFELYNNFTNRLKVSAVWYTDFYEKIVSTSEWFDKVQVSPKLIKSDKSIVLNDDSEKEIETTNFKFYLKKDDFVNQNWSKVTWDIEVHLFDLWENDWDFNNINLDNFDSETWTYMWQSMVTFWMPLIKAYNNWIELEIKEVKWIWKIQNWWKNPWLDLENVPKNKYLSHEELEQYKVPYFRILNRKSWVWYTTDLKILDTDWNYEFIYKQ